MDGFSIGKIILGLQNSELFLKKLKGAESNKIENFAPELNSTLNNSKPQTSQIAQSINNLTNMTQMLQMNNLAGLDKSIFIKNLLGLPQTLGQILMNVQNPNKPFVGGTLNLNSINQELLQNKNALATLFDENIPLNVSINNAIQAQNIKNQQDSVALFFSGMVSMSDVSKLILQNGKQAVAALIIAMASASKQGISNEQVQETLSIINSCI